MLDFSTAQLPFKKTKSTNPEQDLEPVDAAPTTNELKAPWYKRLKRWQLAVINLLVIFSTAVATIGIYTFVISQDLMVQAQTARATGMEAYTSFKGQNLPAT